MTFTPGPLEGSYTIDLSPFGDSRGWFARTYCENEFLQIGHHKPWVQLNHSVTFHSGVIRGMHYQLRPFSEVKMVRCVVGSIFDVIIDIRSDSPTFLKWFGTELSGENKRMLYIPEGFAHGFQTLSENCELIYHHTEFYNPKAEAGIRFDDPKIGIHWPLDVTSLSDRDQLHPYLNNNF